VAQGRVGRRRLREPGSVREKPGRCPFLFFSLSLPHPLSLSAHNRAMVPSSGGYRKSWWRHRCGAPRRRACSPEAERAAVERPCVVALYPEIETGGPRDGVTSTAGGPGLCPYDGGCTSRTSAVVTAAGKPQVGPLCSPSFSSFTPWVRVRVTIGPDPISNQSLFTLISFPIYSLD
jgi:hypothetical protein